MMFDLLTSDNHHLSQSTSEGLLHLRAIDFYAGVSAEVGRFVRDSLSENTRRAYQFDLAHFEAWGGRVPAVPSVVASYLAAHAAVLSVATLVRRVATISKAHEARGFANPCRSEIVRATLRGIKRTMGTAQHEAKPLLKEELCLALDAMGDRPKDARDRALLLVGFAGGFRRSELVGLDCADIEHVRQGIVITLRRSKVDQEARGRKIGIPHGRSRHCPVAALVDWQARSMIEHGPIFRPLNRHGHVQSERLSGEAVSVMIRERVAAAGINPSGFSGHSLRSGFATSAAAAAVSSWRIRQQTGHASDATLARYIRDGELFIDNAAGRCCESRWRNRGVWLGPSDRGDGAEASRCLQGACRR